MTKLYIASCQPFRSGVKDGRNWTLYHVTDPKGLRYGTFNPKYVGMVGMEVDVEVEEKSSDKVNPKTGQPYINRNIIEPKGNNASNAGLGFVIAELKALRAIVEETHKAVMELVVEPTPPDGGPTESDLGKDDMPELPF